MDYVDFDSLAQKLAPTLQVLENKRKELLRKERSEGLIYAAIFLVVGVIALLILKLEGIFGPIVIVDRKSTRLNSSHANESRMPSSA